MVLGFSRLNIVEKHIRYVAFSELRLVASFMRNEPSEFFIIEVKAL